MDTTRLYDIRKRAGQTEQASLGDVLSRSPRTILYFYPRDNTPGCTLEGQDFTRLLPEFARLGIAVVGVSRDSLQSHGKFADSCGVQLDLIADTDGLLHTEFSVIGEKNNYGKVSVGVIRSTFLLDSFGNILREWRNVKATGHAEKILKALS